MKTDPQIGARATAELLVTEAHLASAQPLFAGLEPRLPQVLATIYMAGLMEAAAALVLAPLLEPHETSVGVAIDVSHEAATPAGDTVRAEAILKVVDGTKYVFEVIARDSGGVVGKGSHKRAIVSRAKIEAASRDRSAPQPPPR